jgi:hypothetical protein
MGLTKTHTPPVFQRTNKAMKVGQKVKNRLRIITAFSVKMGLKIN